MSEPRTLDAPGLAGSPEVTTPSPARARTPGLRATGRAWRFWIVAGVIALLAAVVGSLFTVAGATTAPPLAAGSPAPAGSRALVEVLRAQGVTVTVVGSLADARSAARTGANPTLFFHDAHGYLTVGQLRSMAALAPRTVVAAPDFLTLTTLAPGVGFGGTASSGTLDARCAVPAARRAGTLSPEGATLRLDGATARGAAGLTGCFPAGRGTFALVQQVTDAHTVTFVAPTAVFDNEHIATYGNAALALGLLGGSSSLIWYQPTLADVLHTGPPSLGELTPGWVTPAMLLLVLVTVAAGVWRGRRFGSLVAENLPVTVKVSETMEGRARLYARSSARLRALDTLRIGAVSRLSVSLGLPRTATLDEVLQAVSALTGLPIDAVRGIIVDTVPGTDRELVALSDRLAALESDVRQRIEPGWGETSAVTPAPHTKE